jgi:L-ascorbate metabolism protein UlaG (beta-lactamase superfamily)
MLSKFGKLPSDDRLKRIRKSPNYHKEAFQNQNPTPDLTEGVGYWTVAKEHFFTERPHVKPVDTIPSQKTDLLKLNKHDDVLVWFGHSSYFMQIDGKTILVDPVLSGAASPVAFTTRAFKGSDVYTADEIPVIDFLFISHDHWDHLDYDTIMKLKPKIKKLICGLGMGAHFEHWGFDSKVIIERDWNEKAELADGFVAYAVPARHFSGRGLIRNKALWTSFVLYTPTSKIFIGGDSGYDTHFAKIGRDHGPFDLAILENGQYDKSWKYIHMMPHEVLLAANDLRAKNILPVHSAKFALANHTWDEPLRKITQLNDGKTIRIITPMIGERVNIKDTNQKFKHWWEGIA